MYIENCIVSNGRISQTAYEEAERIYEQGSIPASYSTHEELQTLTETSLEEGMVDMDTYHAVVENITAMEYDIAVLLGVLELIHIYE